MLGLTSVLLVRGRLLVVGHRASICAAKIGVQYYIGLMPARTRRAAASSHQQEGDGDDDAPEELSLIGAANLAAAARKQEAAAAAEKKREDKKRSTAHAALKQRTTTHAPVVDDFLSAEVLAELERRRSSSVAAEANDSMGVAQRQAHAVSEALRRKRGLKERLSSGLSKGPVKVAVLSLATRKARALNSNFRRERLQGEGSSVKRSADMLRPPARRGPAAKFK